LERLSDVNKTYYEPQQSLCNDDLSTIRNKNIGEIMNKNKNGIPREIGASMFIYYAVIHPFKWR